MEERYLEHALPFVKKMEAGRKEQFIAYFKTAPVWLLETFQMEEMEKGTVFVREGEPVETIFFILGERGRFFCRISYFSASKFLFLYK